MTHNQSATLALCGAFLLALLISGQVLVVIPASFSVLAFCFVTYLTQKDEDKFKHFESEIKRVEGEIKELNSKISGLQLGKAMGR